MLTLAVALQDSLEAHIPDLIAEVNAEFYPDIPIVPPIIYNKGIRTEMLKRDVEELPVLASDIYVREVINGDYSGPASDVAFPFVIDVYLGDKDEGDGAAADRLFYQTHKWAVVLDLFVERYATDLIEGYTADEAPSLDRSYVLELRGDEYRQLVTATGIITAPE
jgi:hypothetical protein